MFLCKAGFPLPIRSTRSSPTKRSGIVVWGGLPTRYFLTTKKYRVAVEYDMDREALGKCSCISRLIVKQSCGDRIDFFYTICTRSARPLPESGGDRAEIVYGSRIGRDDRAEIGKMSCGGRAYRQEVEKKSCIPFLVEQGRVGSGNVGDRGDRVDRIGSGNPG
ncbi:hypothetical protein DPMN_192389 [Dreissena polymorpha]|uniref:Uncharacterized protein n=1 Tax=Dreissena polymorpha TaxID=45954 RepID=A0A9D4BDL1_DREPO|nr:hypothetical protein DPMN_192389 [Dreissena polymorpha]